MSDGMGRELAYLSSHATNRYFIPNWGNKSNTYHLSSRFHLRFHQSALDDIDQAEKYHHQGYVIILLQVHLYLYKSYNLIKKLHFPRNP